MNPTNSEPQGNRSQGLPEYDEPPLVEVAFAAQFQELKDLSQAEMGLFWQYIYENFPQVQDQPRLGPMSDPIHQPRRPAFELKLSPASPVHRSWFKSPGDERLVQLQPRCALSMRIKYGGSLRGVR